MPPLWRQKQGKKKKFKKQSNNSSVKLRLDAINTSASLPIAKKTFLVGLNFNFEPLLLEQSKLQFGNDQELLKFALQKLAAQQDPDDLICSRTKTMSRNDLKHTNNGKYILEFSPSQCWLTVNDKICLQRSLRD